MQSCYYNSFVEYSLLGNGCHVAVTNDAPIGHENICLSALSPSHWAWFLVVVFLFVEVTWFKESSQNEATSLSIRLFWSISLKYWGCRGIAGS